MTLQLIGMLDSPYVRRVAVSMLVLGVPFTHRSISVFRGFDTFRTINPVVKAPTLIAADGTVLMDSSLMLDYVEALTRPISLMPQDPARLLPALRAVGLALAACEKTAQIVYERGLRPAEKQHQPWVDRVTGQLRAAFAELESDQAAAPLSVAGAALDQAAISVAVAWFFTQQMLPGVVAPAAHPRLVALSDAAEQRAEFKAAPHSEGIVTPLPR